MLSENNLVIPVQSCYITYHQNPGLGGRIILTEGEAFVYLLCAFFSRNHYGGTLLCLDLVFNGTLHPSMPLRQI